MRRLGPHRLSGVGAGVSSLILSLAVLISCTRLPWFTIVPSFLAAFLVYRALSTAEGPLSRFIAIMALLAAIPALGLNSLALVVPFGW